MSRKNGTPGGYKRPKTQSSHGLGDQILKAVRKRSFRQAIKRIREKTRKERKKRNRKISPVRRRGKVVKGKRADKGRGLV